ncbi:hypothetical protein KY385_04420 [Candidatus Parcubacteria bacterium]|nr:hypothetical protein [Candidatus Parcubacteria bacterium]
MISKHSINLFKKASEEIPGYLKFLKSKGCEPKSIVTVSDFARVPITSKTDYLQKYPRKDLVWPKDWEAQVLYCSTSGSTGVPHYFPRNKQLAEKASYMVEEFLDSSSYGEGRVLVIMGFGMGVWIGGIFTMQAFEIAAERTQKSLAILPVGYNQAEVYKALKRLAPDYDQTIIAGYPPFIKELVDDAEEEGIDLAKLNVRFMFAAEAFSEAFRDYVCDKIGTLDPIHDTLNIYGSADIGAMAHETPLSILIRRLAMQHPVLFEEIFGQIEKTPTFAQYNPAFIEFEIAEDQIVLSGDSAMPLIRYAIGDHGGVLSFDEVSKKLKNYGLDLTAEAKKAGVAVTERPFVFVYERTDFSTNLHGINIFPEFIKEGLASPALTKDVTGRFTMLTKYNENHEQFLHINVELKKKASGTNDLGQKVLEAVYACLVEKSSEFAEVARNWEAKNIIDITLWEYGHNRYFKPGSKQRWVEKL